MPLREADLSATPIDDGSLTPLDTAPTSSSFPSSRGPNDYDPSASPSPSRGSGPRPMSPQPKLVLFDPRSGQQETIDLGGSASSIMTLEDYKRLNRRTTERGMITGLIGGGVLTYLVKRFMPKSRTPSRNALSLTFLFSSAFISYSTSRGLLISEILRIRAQARQKALENGELPGGDNAPPSDSMFGDIPGSGDDNVTGFGRGFGNGTTSGSGTSPRDLRSPEQESRRDSPSGFTAPGYRRNDDRDTSGTGGYPGVAPTRNANSIPISRQGSGVVRDELSRLGQSQAGVGAGGGASIGGAPQRTRWAKGRGLEGEVEEEGEMRDPYAAPGQPRLG
ncbi:hypothetical protein I316_02841 [Kwoniella heveanensis BCC8398]|uniref:Uncharacterized protein n=1 Tax=Kwoniella heveanensis BCC8398 TaxID=1296120 RepID=A0A1B9GWL7_9TREE|nr:hypothetical protein I316_02841 [Kwoniella heveanensis BCC8398]